MKNNIKKCDLQGFLRKKMELKDLETHGPLPPTEHSPRTILGFWIYVFLLDRLLIWLVYFTTVLFTTSI